MRTDLKDPEHIPGMPELVGHAQMLEHFWSVGPVMAGGSGPVPLTHLEIRAWQDNTGNELNAWEATLLRSLSIEYLNEFEAAKSPGALAPFTAPIEVDERVEIAKRVRAQFSAMINGIKGQA